MYSRKALKYLREYKWILIALSAVSALAISYDVYLEEQGNFHPITPNEAYRSGHLDRDELEYYLPKYKIRSVLNLLGKDLNDHYYRDEVAVSHELGIAHYDLGLSPDRAPSKKQIERLIHIFAIAPRPIWIHCRAGSDRTGFAAALWKVIVDGESKSEAATQLSISYGHIPFGPTTVLDNFFAKWKPGRE